MIPPLANTVRLVRLNLPSPAGAALGRELARLLGPVPDTCHDCALRLGTRPNQCGRTLLDFLDCSRTGEPFLCHVRGDTCRAWRASLRPDKP